MSTHSFQPSGLGRAFMPLLLQPPSCLAQFPFLSPPQHASLCHSSVWQPAYLVLMGSYGMAQYNNDKSL